MASNENEDIFQCAGCDQFLDLESKTLTCLHSLCRSCVEGHIERAALGSAKCPQCHQPVGTSDTMRLAPFLVKSLRRHHLEVSLLTCDSCTEEGVETSAQIWCRDCEKLLCQNCTKFHQRFNPRHETKDVSGLTRDEVIRVMTTDDCRLHRKSKDAFCDRCNVCLCDTCYEDHVTASPQCPARPLSVREEASKEKNRASTLEQELRQFEMQIRAANEETRRCVDQLATDYDSECLKLWQGFEAFVERARIKLGELCEEMRKASSEQARKWRLSLQKRDDLLKKVEILHRTLNRLLSDDAEDEDVVCGLRLVGAELSPRLRQSLVPAESGHFVVTFPKWCHDSLESLKKETIDWTTQISGHLPLERECRLHGSNPPLVEISSIVADDEDNRVFVGDFQGDSILEFGESGEIVGQCLLTDGGKRFTPFDICRPSQDILVVCGLEFLGRGDAGGNIWGSGRLFFLALQKSRPFLKIQKLIDTKEKKIYSLCKMDKKIFACDLDFQEIICFNEDGEKIKTIQIQGSTLTGRSGPRLRADPTTGNLWGSRFGSSEFLVFGQNGEILQTLKMKEEICDFRSNKFGHFYFSTEEGIFSLLPKKSFLFKFPQKSEEFPTIFVSRQKLFVSLKNDGKYLLNILKIN